MACQILIVDDHPGTAHLTSLLCEGEGFTPVWAANAHDALLLLAGRHFDLAVIDIAMPDMDGLTLTRTIRGMQALDGLPVLGMTAMVGPEIREQARLAGMDRLFHKPFEVDEVRQTLLSLLGR